MANEVEEIKQRLDIVEIINDYLPLKRAGSNYKGVCPFHQENTPSFMASSAKQIWHCFGCHKGGDVFSFVQEIEGIDFYEALKLLGNKAGVKIEQKERKDTTKKDHLKEILDLSAKFYNKILLDHPKAEDVRNYVFKERGISEQTVKDWQIGFAPESWELLFKFLKGKGYSSELIKDSGLVVFNQERNSLYDRFRNRMMIPLADVYGNIVGFTARALGDDYQGGKYINTPQTELYDKSRIAYGLHLAKQSIKESGFAVIVEGNMDVITAHQAGFKQLVAVSGTAMTDAQLGLLKRFTQTLIFAFDEDEAGQLAMRRGVELALGKGFDVKVLELPIGKDPDECIRQDAGLFKKAIANAKSIFDVLIQRSAKKYDLTSSQGKKEAALNVLLLLKFLPSPVERDHYLEKLALKLQVSANSLVLELSQLAKNKAAVPIRGQGEQKLAPSPTKDVSPEEETSWGLLALLLKKPAFMVGLELSEEAFFGSVLPSLYKKMKTFYSMGKQEGQNDFDKNVFLKGLSPELQTIVTRLDLLADKEFASLEESQIRDAIKARISYLKRLFLRRNLQRVQTSLQDAEQSKNRAAIETLSKEFEEISSQLHNL